MSNRHRRASPVDGFDDDSASRKCLKPVGRLAHARMRVSWKNISKPYRTDKATGQLVCNGCERCIAIDRVNLSPEKQDEQLRMCVFQTTWQRLHWKTFLCGDCQCRATAACLLGTRVCVNCLKPDDIVPHEIHYESSAEPGTAELLNLCTACTSTCEPQLKPLKRRNPVL